MMNESYRWYFKYKTKWEFYELVLNAGFTYSKPSSTKELTPYAILCK